MKQREKRESSNGKKIKDGRARARKIHRERERERERERKKERLCRITINK